MAAKSDKKDGERRVSTREPLKIPVDYSAVDAFFSDFCSNINEGGMFLETETPAPLDSDVQLQFRVPNLAEPIQVSGRVAWISDGKGESAAGMGVEFKDLSEDAKSTLDELVRELRKG